MERRLNCDYAAGEKRSKTNYASLYRKQYARAAERASKRGAGFDLQAALEHLPPFPWSKYEPEKHVPSYNYLGPGTRLDIRLDASDRPRPGEEPISATDALALKHDLAYRDAKSLADKHAADREMLEELEDASTSGVGDWLANKAAKAALWAKLKVGAALGDAEARDFANELRALRRFEESAASLPSPAPVRNIDELHAGALTDFGRGGGPFPSGKAPLYHRRKRYTCVLVNVDAFSGFCWCAVLPGRGTDDLIWAYERIFENRTPQKLWLGTEAPKEFVEFLGRHNVELYRQACEAPVVARLIHTLKEGCEIIKTEYGLRGEYFDLVEVLPEVLKAYNFETGHSAH